MSSTVGAQSNGVKVTAIPAGLTSLTAAHKTDLNGYKNEAGYEFKTGYTTEAVYKAEHGHKDEHHHHGHRDEHHHHGYKEEHHGHRDEHHHGYKEEHHHHGHRDEHHYGHRDEHHHGHKEEHHHCCSSEYGFGEDISVHFSEEHKQQLKTCTSSLGHVLSQVPWMKFRVVAEPDMNCFATDERLQIFMKKVTEITIAIVTKQIREEVTEMISKLVTSILTTMTTRISAVQKVVFEHVEEIFSLEDTVAGYESLCDIQGKICFGGERCKPSTEKKPERAPYNTKPKVPAPKQPQSPARAPVDPKPTPPKEPKKLDDAPDTKPKEPATKVPVTKEPAPKEPAPKESRPPAPAPVDSKPTLPKEPATKEPAPKEPHPPTPAPVDPKPTLSLPKEPLVPASPTAPKSPPSVALANAKWIWTHEKPVSGGKPYSRPFRHVVHTDTPVDRLTISIACDNRYTLYVNGLLVGRGQKWSAPDRYTVSFEARKDVLIAVYGSEDSGGTTVALIASGKVWSSRAGESIEKEFATSKTWKTKSKDNFDIKFFELSYKDADWEAATELNLPWKILFPTHKGKDFERWTGRKGLQDAPDAPKATVIL